MTSLSMIVMIFLKRLYDKTKPHSTITHKNAYVSRIIDDAVLRSRPSIRDPRGAAANAKARARSTALLLRNRCARMQNAFAARAKEYNFTRAARRARKIRATDSIIYFIPELADFDGYGAALCTCVYIQEGRVDSFE